MRPAVHRSVRQYIVESPDERERQLVVRARLRGGDGLDDDLEGRLNAALWQYGERVATLIGDDLEAFVRETQR